MNTVSSAVCDTDFSHTFISKAPVTNAFHVPGELQPVADTRSHLEVENLPPASCSFHPGLRQGLQWVGTVKHRSQGLPCCFFFIKQQGCGL